MKLVWISCLLAAVGPALGSPLADRASKVQLELFYDAFCPYAENFIHSQLLPTAKALSKYLTISLYPFADVDYVLLADLTYDYRCKNGDWSCDMAKKHTCVQAYVEDQLVEVNLIDCIITSSSSSPVSKCLSGTVPSSTISQIDNCINSKEGSSKFESIGQIAKSKGVLYSPWIIVNDEHNEELQQQASKDLHAFLCGNYLKGVPECSPSSMVRADIPPWHPPPFEGTW